MIQEPILQFLFVALILFLANYLVHGSKSNTSTQLVTISRGQVQQIAERFRLLANRSPNPTELRALVNEFVDEEISYREAIARSLDVDDTIVRRRMRQKLEFLAEDGNATEEPGEQQLKVWLSSHPEKYQLPNKLSFKHVLASRDIRSDKADLDAQKFLLQLNAGEKPDTLGDASMLPLSLSLMSQKRIATLFGESFAKSIFSITENGWFGPIKSPYGSHLVLITERKASITPAFNQIHDQLRTDWIESKRRQAKNNFLSNIRQGYIVNIEWPNKNKNENENEMTSSSNVFGSPTSEPNSSASNASKSNAL